MDLRFPTNTVTLTDLCVNHVDDRRPELLRGVLIPDETGDENHKLKLKVTSNRPERTKNTRRTRVDGICSWFYRSALGR